MNIEFENTGDQPMELTDTNQMNIELAAIETMGNLQPAPYLGATIQPTAQHHDELYVEGPERRIGLGICCVCRVAPNNCVLIKRTGGSFESCGHLVCSTCADCMLPNGGSALCPICRSSFNEHTPTSLD